MVVTLPKLYIFRDLHQKKKCQKIPLYSQAVSAEGGEDEWVESGSEEDFRGVGGEGVGAYAPRN